MDENIYLTVCTPTYNREQTLHIPFESLMKQTNKNFKWLIIDDGSTDNTKQLVDEYKKKSDFEIEYHYKKNEGRCIALNYSYQFIKTEWVINLDSDDAYCEQTIEKIINIINKLKKMKKEEYNEIWQISGRCIDSETKEMIGPLYPDNINELSRKKQDKVRAKVRGEKSCCRKLEILKKFPFPQFDDTKYAGENMVWYNIDLYYKTYCTNEVFRIYYRNTIDSATSEKSFAKTRLAYHYNIFLLNKLFNQFTYKFEVRRSIINVARNAILTDLKYKTVMSELEKWYIKLLVSIIGYPMAHLYIILKKEKKYKNN